MRRRVQRKFDKEEFFRFAKSYLSEAFPNPQRIDCAEDSELIGLASIPRKLIPSSLSTSPAAHRASTATWKYLLP
jgi:hypothetical protein